MPGTPSTRWGITKPADGDLISGWPGTMRSAIDAIDALMVAFNTTLPRPSAGSAGRFHRDSGTGVISFDTGAGWAQVTQTPHAADHVEGGPDPIKGQVPIGGIISYAGGSLPPGTEWDWADGGLIDKTTFATFFGRVGHNYNGGVDPGSNKVRKPDKRGRVSMGADNFGPLGAANRVTVSPATRGGNGGEERHTTSVAELPAHSHPASSGTESADHTHGGSTDTQGNHAHNAGSGSYLLAQTDNSAGGFFAASGGGGTLSVAWYANTNTTGAHSHGISTGGRSVAHTHAITVSNNTGGGGSHQNLQPYEADTYLVRIA